MNAAGNLGTGTAVAERKKEKFNILLAYDLPFGCGPSAVRYIASQMSWTGNGKLCFCTNLYTAY
jgi:hypothetical protein